MLRLAENYLTLNFLMPLREVQLARLEKLSSDSFSLYFTPKCSAVTLFLTLFSSYAELMQTEMHHVRTLKIMNDVYSAGMLKELQYDQQIVDKIFPCLENLLHIHSHFFQRILERKKESLADKSEKNFVIKRIGDILVNQVSCGK